MACSCGAAVCCGVSVLLTVAMRTLLVRAKVNRKPRVAGARCVSQYEKQRLCQTDRMVRDLECAGALQIPGGAPSERRPRPGVSAYHFVPPAPAAMPPPPPAAPLDWGHA